MKPLFILVALLTVGCNSVKRLTEGSEAPKRPEPQVIRSIELGPTPVFDVPTPAGTTRVVHHAMIPSNGVINGVESSNLKVFVRDDATQTWFIVGPSVSALYYYGFASHTLTIHGQNLGMKEYCLYVYVGA